MSPRLPAPSSDAARAKALNDELGAVAPKSCNSPTTWSSTTFGGGPTSVCGIAASVTIAALAAMGDDDQLDFYLRRGVESGLTRNQITEALTHLGFYAGWPKATKAIAAVARSLGR